MTMKRVHLLTIVLGAIGFGLSYLFVTNNSLNPSLSLGIEVAFWSSIVLSILNIIMLFVGLAKFQKLKSQLPDNMKGAMKKYSKVTNPASFVIARFLLYIILGAACVLGYYLLRDFSFLAFTNNPSAMILLKDTEFLKGSIFVASSFILSVITWC